MPTYEIVQIVRGRVVYAVTADSPAAAREKFDNGDAALSEDEVLEVLDQRVFVRESGDEITDDFDDAREGADA